MIMMVMMAMVMLMIVTTTALVCQSKLLHHDVLVSWYFCLAGDDGRGQHWQPRGLEQRRLVGSWWGERQSSEEVLCLFVGVFCISGNLLVTSICYFMLLLACKLGTECGLKNFLIRRTEKCQGIFKDFFSPNVSSSLMISQNWGHWVGDFEAEIWSFEAAEAAPSFSK